MRKEMLASRGRKSKSHYVGLSVAVPHNTTNQHFLPAVSTQEGHCHCIMEEGPASLIGDEEGI